jgi:SAM-dependent methyltransferase
VELWVRSRSDLMAPSFGAPVSHQAGTSSRVLAPSVGLLMAGERSTNRSKNRQAGGGGRSGQGQQDASEIRLPTFTEHSGHAKLEQLTRARPPDSLSRSFLEHVASGRRAEQMKILEVGCGRGDVVAWLLDEGWDAYGADVDDRYLRNGRAMLGNRVRLIAGNYPFEDSTFDAVLSYQVLEHVMDLESFAHEVARVSAAGGEGLHVFPSKWRVLESHLHMPCVHWLPKGAVRRTALRGLLKLGVGAKYFPEYSNAERAEIFAQYSEHETFYRSIGHTKRVFEAAGLKCDHIAPVEAKLKEKWPALPAIALKPVGWLYRSFWMACVRTYKH